MNKAPIEGQTITFEVTSKDSLRKHAASYLYTSFIIYAYVSIIFSSYFSWYDKAFLSVFFLPIIVVIIYAYVALGHLSGKIKVRFSNEGIEYLNIRSNLERWVDRKILKISEPLEYVFIPWNGLHRIDCNDRRKEDRKRNRKISPEPQIIFSYLDGQQFNLHAGVFPDDSRFNSKIRMIYEELKKEAAQRGIPFTTELESEDSWIE